MASNLAISWLMLQAALVAGRSLSVGRPDVYARVDTPLELGQAAGAVAPAGAPQRTIMQCLGTQTLTRACHFEHLYYELGTSQFVFYGMEGATPEVFGDPGRGGDPWLRLVRGYTKWRRGQVDVNNQFHMEWRAGDALPAPEHVAAFERPLHLRSPYNTKSIGHLLRDNLQFLVDLPLRFGRDPVDFDWVRWETETAWGAWRNETQTSEHYRGLLNNRPSVTWNQVLRKALQGKDKSQVKYILFSELIGGQGPADIATQMGSLDVKISTIQLAAWAHMCDPFPFTAMREIAYRNYGLKVAAAPDLEPFVLFLDGQPRERRHLNNADQLLPKLRETFPGVRMEHVEISALPLEEQLKLLSQATVVVSNIGSRSFRLIYLPNGATTILVGPPEFEFDLVPPEPGDLYNPHHPVVEEVTPYTISKPFLEIDWCWGYIGYVNMLRYRVESEAEVNRTERWFSWTDARNTDIILDEAKITRLVSLALDRTERSIAQHGSGTLSALAR